MYFNLALKNVKKSYKDYVIYFMTLTFSVALFYVFNSFEQQSFMLILDTDGSYMVETLNRVMKIMSVIVSVIFGFLILYANNFLIKRRKKELGLYNLLGMPKKKINLVLIYETLLISVFSLITGLALGVVLSHLTAILSAKILLVSAQFQFVFSFEALLITVLSFMMIFIIVVFFNSYVLSKYQLIDLLKAKRKNEKLKVSNTIIILIISLISALGLYTAYTMALDSQTFINKMYIIVPLGTLSTFGIFFVLSALLMRLSRLFQNFYYKDLNLFIFRQLGSKISSTYKIMAVVSLSLLIGIGALATSFNISNILQKQFESDNPYDMSISISHNENMTKEEAREFLEIDEIDYQDLTVVDIYHTGINLESLQDQVISKRDVEDMDLDFEIAIIDLQTYNKLRKTQDLSQISLNEDELVYFSSLPLESLGRITASSEKEYYLNENLNFANNQFKIKNSKNHNDYYVGLRSRMTFHRFFMVMNNDTFLKVKNEVDSNQRLHDSTYYNFDFDKDTSEEEVYDIMDRRIELLLSNEDISTFNIASKFNAKANLRESTLLFTYVGLYLGSVFIITSAVILSLQLLSEASDNQQRYKILNKIGVSNKLARKSVFKQNLIYFSIPMLLALLHSWVGIKAINQILLAEMDYISNNNIIYFTIGTVLIVYTLYFLFTYKSSINIIEEKNKEPIL